MRGHPLGLGLALSLLAAFVPPSTARAQQGVGLGAASPPDVRTDITAARPYWGAGPPRFFASVMFETAGISVRDELAVGYGRPHHTWAGLQIDNKLSLSSLTFFGGVRAVAPWGSVKFGPRFVTAANQKLIPEADVVTKTMLDAGEGLRSKYLSLDAEASFSIPLPFGAIGLLATGYGLVSVEDDHYVFEDSLRVVIEPPFVGRFRASYLAPIGSPATLKIGALAELIYNPGREYFNVRLGPAVAVSLTHHLEAVASVALSVYNPDEIGVAGADLGQIGLRYRWATGDLWPEFP